MRKRERRFRTRVVGAPRRQGQTLSLPSRWYSYRAPSIGST